MYLDSLQLESYAQKKNKLFSYAILQSYVKN